MNMNNRQNNRRRGRNNSGGGNNRAQQGGRGGFDSGNRIDSRARGNATQMIEKYKNMARDAQLAGDRVQTEYYLQFADHYFRVMSDFRARQDEGRPQGERGQDRLRGADLNDYDDFDGMGSASDEGRTDDARGDDEAADNDREESRRDDGRRDDNRQRQPRRDDNRRDENRGDRGDRGDRSGRGDRNDRGDRGDRGGDRAGGNRRDADEDRSVSSDDAAPRRAGPGPRRGARAERPVADDGDIGLDLAVLPPAIGRSADDAIDADTAPAAKPRPALKPRRPRKAADDGEAGTPAEAAE